MKTMIIFSMFSVSCFGGLIDSVNLNEPASGDPELATEIGWLYTIQSSVPYYMDTVLTRFGSWHESDMDNWNRKVILEIYSAHPNENGQLLRSALFQPLPNVFSGGTFDPLLVKPSDVLFIGLRNVKYLGMNMPTLGIDNLTTYASISEPPLGFYETKWPNGSYPILAFYGEPVPEPTSLLLLGLGAILSCCHKQRTDKCS